MKRLVQALLSLVMTLTMGADEGVGVRFSGEPGRYVRSEVSLPLGARPPARD